MNCTMIELHQFARDCSEEGEWIAGLPGVSNATDDIVSEIAPGDQLPLTSLDFAVAKAMGCAVRLFAVLTGDGKDKQPARVQTAFITLDYPFTEVIAGKAPASWPPAPHYVRVPIAGKHDILESCLDALSEGSAVLGELAITRRSTRADRGNLALLTRPCRHKDIEWLLERLGHPARAVTVPVWMTGARRAALPVRVLAQC